MYALRHHTNRTMSDAWDFLSGDLRRDRRNVRLVMETVGELYGRVDPDDRMRRAVDRAILVTEAQRGILFIEDEGGLKPRVARDAQGNDLPLDLAYSTTVVQQVWTSGAPVRESWHENVPNASRSLYNLRLQSILAMRLRYEGRPLGVLYVDATWGRRDFTESEFKVFRSLGGLVATALENSRLEAVSAERSKVLQQVALAREVQERLLPRDLDVPEGLDVAGVGRVCHGLSGDYYDVIQRPDGQIALVVGDVSGGGVSTALHTASVRALLRRLVREGCEPSVALAELNHSLATDMGDADFMTLFVGLLDPEAGTFVFASAGHPPPLLRRADGSRVELMATGLPLHVLPGATWSQTGPLALRPGDVLFLYTDGLTEAHHPDGDLYGEERLEASLERAASAGEDARGLLARVLADLDDWRRGQELLDDITCLVVRPLR